MIDSKSYKQTKPRIAADPNSPPTKLALMPDTASSQDRNRIRERAYELYENRGRESGREEQDWLRAETEILKRGQ
jgi:hypothetical protein